MPAIIFLIAVIIICAKRTSENKNQKNGKNGKPPAGVTRAKKVSPLSPAANRIVKPREGEDPCHEDMLTGSDSYRNDRHDPGTSGYSMYEDPFTTESTEGTDPCHEEMLTGSAPACTSPEKTDSDLSANALLQGIVMTEILQKPVSLRRKA